MATEVGTAYVSLQADTRDVEKNVKQALDKSVQQADKAGKDMGNKLSKGVAGGMDKTGAKAGDAFTKGFGPKVTGGGKNAMAGLGQLMMGSAEGIGSNVGGGIMGSLVGALNQGASKAIGALEGIGTRGAAGMSTSLVAAGTIAAGGVALVTAAAVVAGKALYDIGESWDGISDGIIFKTGKVGAELGKITDSIKKVGMNSFAPIEDIGGVATALVKGLNLSGGALEEMTNKIANYNSMASENGVEPLNITEFMKAMKRFKMEGDVPAMSATLDQLFDVSRNTTIPLNSLISTMKNIGTQARDFKLPAATVIQMLAEFDNAGMDASTAMIGFRTAMNKLATEADPAGALRNQITTIQELANKSDDASQAKAREMTQTLFGNKAWQTYFDLIRDGKIDVDNLTAVTTNSTDSINKAREQTADFSQEWEKFKNFLKVDLEPVATFVFGAINTQLTYLVNNIRDGIGAIKSFIDTFRNKWAEAKQALTDDGGLFGPNSAIGRLWRGVTGGGWEDAAPGGWDGTAGGGGANRSAAGLQPQTADLQEQIAKAFPAIKDIGGFRANDPYPDHPSGKALDVMIPPEMVGTTQGNLLGTAIAKYALQNGAQYVMWQQKRFNADGSSSGMENRGSPTQNHMDHVHILTRDKGGPLPPGVSVVHNGTGKDELVLTAEQQQMLADQGIDVQALMSGGKQPLEDQEGWDWRTMGNRQGGPGVDPNYGAHGTLDGAAPGPTMDYTSGRTEGFTPTAAANSGVAGTSSFAALINMGAEAANGAIDMAAGAASMGANAFAPGSGMAVDMGAAIAKRGVSYGFQMAGIGVDALIEQIFPFGAPRWAGYDYTNFQPTRPGAAAVTTGEKADAAAAGLPGQDPGGMVNPETAPGQGQPITDQPRPDAAIAPASNMEVTNLQPASSPPLVQIGSITGHTAGEVAGQIESRQRLAMMQYAGRP